MELVSKVYSEIKAVEFIQRAVEFNGTSDDEKCQFESASTKDESILTYYNKCMVDYELSVSEVEDLDACTVEETDAENCHEIPKMAYQHNEWWLSCGGKYLWGRTKLKYLNEKIKLILGRMAMKNSNNIEANDLVLEKNNIT